MLKSLVTNIPYVNDYNIETFNILLLLCHQAAGGLMTTPCSSSVI